ncbi:MAG: hypothetical protein AB8G99_26800, partial [Planctomycetaceae bacterium]
LDKDRTRRYDTASALAEDSARYIEGGRVLARPPTVLYKLAKWYGRARRDYRGWFVASFMMLLLAWVIWGLARFKFYESKRIESLTTEVESLATGVYTAHDEWLRQQLALGEILPDFHDYVADRKVVPTSHEVEFMRLICNLFPKNNLFPKGSLLPYTRNDRISCAKL